MALKDRLKSDLKEAMKAKDSNLKRCIKKHNSCYKTGRG